MSYDFLFVIVTDYVEPCNLYFVQIYGWGFNRFLDVITLFIRMRTVCISL